VLGCLIEFAAIGATTDSVEFLLSIVDAERIVEKNMFEDSIEFFVDEIDGGAVSKQKGASVLRRANFADPYLRPTPNP
jgi:hypothetical protein